MAQSRLLTPENLAAFAKECRERKGISKSELARQLGVNRATIQQAEEMPELSLAKLRIRIIEYCSPYSVDGPVFKLTRKRRSSG